jgi:hypothetical protein
MNFVKLQLNTQPELNRDMSVTLVNEATGKETSATPFLDGSVRVSNVDPGAYRVKVRHPNVNFDIADQRIRVFPDRPTIVPITIPPDLFQDTPIKTTQEADLRPVRDKLSTAADSADRQAKKRGGQPIYADDWNDLAGTTGDLARTALDMTQRVSPLGHAHPELVAKLDEIQGNLNRFLDVFGKSLAELQREIQTIALQKRVDDALNNIPNVPQQKRDEMNAIVQDVADATDDNPYVYTSRVKQAGDKITAKLYDLTQDPAVRAKPEVDALAKTGGAMSSSLPVSTYDAEINHAKRIDKSTDKSSISVVLKK